MKCKYCKDGKLPSGVTCGLCDGTGNPAVMRRRPLIDMSNRPTPTRRYRWGYVPINIHGYCNPVARWFKTRKAAQIWARKYGPSYAIARYSK